MTSFSGDSGVTVLLGRGDGSLEQPKTYGNSKAVGVKVADFNRDGKPDIATANGYDEDVSILLGKGDGTFLPPTHVSVNAPPYNLEPWALEVADFNKDGNPDIAALLSFGSLGQQGVSVLFGDGTGQLKPPVRYVLQVPNVSSNETFAVGDFNGDGAPDIAYDEIRSVVLFGTGNGSFNVVDVPALKDGILEEGDFNRDGKADLIVQDFSAGSGQFRVLLGQANGTFTSASAETIQLGGGLVIADFDGDSALDLLAGVKLWKGNGQGAFQAGDSLHLLAGAGAAGDFNGDGRVDVVRYDATDVGVALGSGNGRFESFIKVDANPDGPVLARDVNADGQIDIVTTTGSTKEVNVFFGRPGGQFDPAVNYPTGENAPTALAAADFNSDRRLDVVSANGTGNDVSVLLGTGGGQFASPVRFPVGTKPSGVATGDFNGDNHPDLAVANSGSNDISVLLGDGAGGFASAANAFKVGLGPTTVVARDFNGDGKLDLAIGGVGRVVEKQIQRSDLTVLLGDGTGRFQPGFVEPNLDSLVMAVVDLNRDGVLDIVSANASGGSVFLGKADGMFEKAKTRIAFGPFNQRTPTAGVAGDVDGDGHIDLAVTVRGGTSTKLSLVRGNGDGTFKDAVRYNAARFTFMSGGDFDRNGTLDLVGAGPGIGLNVVFQTGCLQ